MYTNSHQNHPRDNFPPARARKLLQEAVNILQTIKQLPASVIENVKAAIETIDAIIKK